MPIDVEQRVAELISILDEATRDPSPSKMQAARAAYADYKQLLIVLPMKPHPVERNIEPELKARAALKTRFEAAADRLRHALRDRGLLDEKLE